MKWAFRLTLSLALCSLAFYSYLREQNLCTDLQIRLPKIAKEIESLHQENSHLQYQIVCFESPDHLLQLAQDSSYSHLQFPSLNDVLALQPNVVLEEMAPYDITVTSKSKDIVVVGATKVYP